MVFLCGTGTGVAASDPYGEDDPFDEHERISRVRALGWDLSQELEVEFQFDFVDRPETRERYARTFAARLRRLGYPEASAQACAKADACWRVSAPKRVRVDRKKLIALSKELLGLERVFGEQCVQVRPRMEGEAEQFDAAGKTSQAYAMRSSLNMMCTCMPKRARQLRSALPQEERDAAITETEFTQRYALPAIMQPCAAAMVRKWYGDDCPALAEGLKANVASYCPCMRAVVADLTEAEIAQLGLESANYMPLAAQADKEGKSRPEPPALFKRFTEKEVACRK